jgi:hypothetical protein
MPIPAPTPATGTHFYKYSGLQRPEQLTWLRTIILENLVYLPTLDQLNDPADGRPVVSQVPNDKMFEFLYKAGRNPTLTSAAQEKSIHNLRTYIERNGPEVMRRELSKILNRNLGGDKGFRIYSMTKRWDNLALWAKYADDYRGYCLEFVNEGELFQPHTVEVRYEASAPIDITDPKQRSAYFLACKKPEWSNEEEVRLIRARGGASMVLIKPEWVSRIILGENILVEHEKAIREFCKQRQPELVVVKAYFDPLDQTVKLKS